MSSINVLYHGCPFDLSGYGTVARNHLLGMAKIKNLAVRLRTKKFWTGVSPDLRGDGETLHALERNPIAENDFIFLHHLTPENFFIDPRSKYHVCYTPFETDGIPSQWLIPMRAMDEIWVPSNHNKTAYLKSGLSKKRVEVIQHGVDTSRYNTDVTPLEYNRGKFNFGSVFDWTERKNPTALIRAYYNAFHRGEDVTLTIRTFWRFPIEKTKEYIYGEVAKIKDGYADRTEFPKILFWFDTMDEAVMPSFYRSFNCFVSASRGEGFGLPMLEAMACGVPTIGPKWGGNIDFMNDTNSFPVEGVVVPIDNSNFLRLQPQYSGQRWFDISEEALSKTMKWVYDNKEKADKIAAVGAEEVKKNWTWDITVGKIYKRLLEIKAALDTTVIVPGGDK